jgi:hypothetical protein
LNPTKPKPYPIAKRQVWDAYRRVKANKGVAGVDKQTLQDFESDLENNLYKLWNRLASSSYMAPAVRRVEIPKANGGVRPLGIPTPTDTGRTNRLTMHRASLDAGAGSTTGCSSTALLDSSTTSIMSC